MQVRGRSIVFESFYCALSPLLRKFLCVFHHLFVPYNQVLNCLSTAWDHHKVTESNFFEYGTFLSNFFAYLRRICAFRVLRLWCTTRRVRHTKPCVSDAQCACVRSATLRALSRLWHNHRHCLLLSFYNDHCHCSLQHSFSCGHRGVLFY